MFDLGTYLIERGARVGFHLACARNDTDRVRAYLEWEPNLLHSRREKNQRMEGSSLPITIAAVYGATEVIEILLDAGASVNTQDTARGNATPLHFAGLWGRPALTEFLLQRGADSRLQASWSNEGLNEATPAEWAVVGKREGWGVHVVSRGSGQHNAVLSLYSDRA